MGPITVFDKSTLQALTIDEAVWFDTFFLANITPLFYVETLADLEKEVARGRTPERFVGALAAKTPLGGAPNVHHSTLVSAELEGAQIDMSGRVLVGAGSAMKAPDGKTGIHIDEFPEAAALNRWKDHEFLEIERDMARHWRAELAAHDPARIIGIVKNIVPSGTKVSDLGDLKRAVDTFCTYRKREVIELALEVLGVPWLLQWLVVYRWERSGRSPLEAFAPYSAHVFKVDLVYYLGIHHGFISGERQSNRADMAYLYYLPFVMVFVSGDNLHQRTAPLFLTDEQSYLETRDLKTALSELDEHYDRFPESVKELGVLQFALFPPADLDNVVTRLWDKHMRPDWRETARRNEAALGKPREAKQDRETLAEIKNRLQAARPVSAADSFPDGDTADYMVIGRQVPVTRGKWRMVSKEVAEAETVD